jgi:uncharacterized protein YceK
LAIVLSVLLLFAVSACSSCIFCPRSNQKQQIEEEQTTQWPQDTKGAIRSSK